MKRILSIAAAVLFAALTVLAPIARAGGGPVVFSMNSVDNVSPGESFTITLSISGEYQAHGMNLSIEYDPNAMTLESCDQGGYLNAIRADGAVALLDAETLAPAGKIKLGVIMPSDPATGSGDVLIMRFHVNQGVTVNQQVIMVIHEFIYMPISAKTGTDIPFSTHNSIITLRGGATPEAGYNEGDDGIGNNISSSPSQPPEPTPGGSTNTTPPIATVPPTVTNEPGTTAAPNTGKQTAEPGTTPTAASESEQPYEAITASPDGTVTASPETSGEPIETITASPDGTVTASPEANAETPDENATDKPAGETAEERGGDTKKESKASPVPYIAAGAAAIAAVGAGIVLINKKKRG